MTVRELIEALKKFPEDHLVIVASDSEGNTISPLESVTGEEYVRTAKWCGELGIGHHNAVVLRPIN